MIVLGQKSILVLNVGPSFSCYLRIRFNLTEPCNFIVTFFIHSNLTCFNTGQINFLVIELIHLFQNKVVLVFFLMK
jgi:hypothetical protein